MAGNERKRKTFPNWRIKIMWKGLFCFLYSLAFAFFGLLHKLVSGSWLSTKILGNLGNWNSTWEWSFVFGETFVESRADLIYDLEFLSMLWLRFTMHIAINSRETIENFLSLDAMLESIVSVTFESCRKQTVEKRLAELVIFTTFFRSLNSTAISIASNAKKSMINHWESEIYQSLIYLHRRQEKTRKRLFKRDLSMKLIKSINSSPFGQQHYTWVWVTIGLCLKQLQWSLTAVQHETRETWWLPERQKNLLLTRQRRRRRNCYQSIFDLGREKIFFFLLMSSQVLLHFLLQLLLLLLSMPSNLKSFYGDISISSFKAMWHDFSSKWQSCSVCFKAQRLNNRWWWWSTCESNFTWLMGKWNIRLTVVVVCCVYA